MCLSKTYLGICVFSMIWTFVQSIIHIGGIILGYYATQCKFKPTHILTSIFYVTYFYQSKCGALTPVDTGGVHFWDIFISDDDMSKLSHFYNDVIKVNNHVENENGITRMKTWMEVIFLSDCFWVISAASLGMGVLFRIKEKWCFFFYGPYVFFTFIVIIVDVISTTVFALDIPKTSNVSQWLDFMNIDNINATMYTDVPAIYLNLPAIILTAYSSRIVIVWLINILCCFLVLRATIINSRLPFEQNSNPNPTTDNNEDRIRTWQMFYEDTQIKPSTSGIMNQTNNRELRFQRTPVERKRNFREHSVDGAGRSSRRPFSNIPYIE
ncbi:hypothetical protein HHI36_020861 [Cryptolaemus montrouzieri]|uniref:Uncharacterized protein n=1 Tax=Cryptolaemus montrouzieri TaxID=559131 RepID=A0ABD2NBX4_9CUCU